MEIESIYYDIHGFLKVQINRRKCKEYIEDINMPYSYFRVNEINEPDIILNIGDFEPQNEDCYIVDHKCHIKNDYIFSREQIGKIKFSVEIQGLNSKQTIINVSNNVKKIRQLFLPSVLPQYVFLRPLIDYKLTSKDYLSLHACAVGNDDGALVFPGRGGSFKTTIAMDYIRKEKYQFLGDDRVIVKNNHVYAYPIHWKLFSYRLNKMETENYSLFDRYKFLTFQKDKISKNFIMHDSKINNIIFLVKQTGESMVKREVHSEDARNKIVTSHTMENLISPTIMGVSEGVFYEYMTAYSYIFPKSDVAAYWDKYSNLVKQYLNDNSYHEISLPKTYANSTFNDFIHVLGDDN